MPIKLLMSYKHFILGGPLLFLPSIFPVSGSFLMSLLFASGSQSTGASASASLLPVNIQDWFPLGLTGLIFLKSKGLSRIFPNTTVQKPPWHSSFFMVPLSHRYMTTGKTIVLTRQAFVGKIMFLLFNILSRLAIVFLLRSKLLLISWLQSSPAVILKPH